MKMVRLVVVNGDVRSRKKTAQLNVPFYSNNWNNFKKLICGNRLEPVNCTRACVLDSQLLIAIYYCYSREGITTATYLLT